MSGTFLPQYHYPSYTFDELLSLFLEMLMQDEYKCFTQLPTIAILSSITTAYRPKRYNRTSVPYRSSSD